MASPILSRTNPASVVRNSETSDPLRKSFAGNPFVKPSITANSRGLNPKTPANSPLDYRRSSTGSRNFEEKENGKDHNHKPARIRSPTIPNGAKNFMSPTISASSKIAMSPKKRILVEKNEPVRASLSISDLKTSSINLLNNLHEAIQPTSVDFSSADFSSDLMDRRPAFQTSSSTPKLSKTETFTDCATKHSASLSNTSFEDAINLADRFKISPALSYPSPKSSCSTIAPLDADPSMPSYDSKTNYLSPRPQFLLYRRNPRMELYLHKEEDGKRLEGSSLSESFSDTEVTEETQLESFTNSDKFVEVAKQEQEENAEAQRYRQPFNLYKLTVLILVLCFGCSSVLYSTPLVKKNNYPSEFYQFAKLSYPELAENLWVLSKTIVAYAHGVIMNNYGEEQGLSQPVQYFNLTALQEEISIDGYFVFDQNHRRIDGFLSEPTREIEVESESFEEENELLQKNLELEEEEEAEPRFEEQEHPEHEFHEGLESEGVVQMNNKLEVKDEKQLLKPVKVLSGENGAVAMNHNSEVKDEKLPSKLVGVEEVEEESSELDVKLNDDASESFKSSAMAALSNVNPPISDSTNKQVISVILLLPLMAAAAAAAYFYSTRDKTKSSNGKESKAKDMNSPKDDDMMIEEESCPSELSSFMKSSSYGNRGAEEMKKLTKNCRRESVSSSTDSPSYGSFTAYKIFSTKHRNCEEEVVTPVRRSSRIKTKWQ